MLVVMLLAMPLLAATHAEPRLPGTPAAAVEQLLGITPALANTPFLGMAALCGLSILVDTPMVRDSHGAMAEALKRNELIVRMRPYSSGWLFAILLGLALLAYATNSGKIRGILGKGVHLTEAGTVLIAYTLLSSTVLREMGLLSVTTGVVLALSLFAALAMMMFVRFAIGIAVWLIPIPFVDVAFETVKKIVTVFIVIIYLINPLLAMLIALGMIAVSLLVARWAWRLVMFAVRIIVAPRLGNPPPPANDRLVTSAAAISVPGLHRRASATLSVDPDGIWLQPRSRSKTPCCFPSTAGARLMLVEGFWWSELRDVDEQGRMSRIAFPTALFPHVQQATRPFGVAIDRSKLSLWLSTRRELQSRAAVRPSV
jgi:hypothetical protein